MAEQGFTLTSPTFPNGGHIPASQTCDGDDLSPELNWMHPPDGTRSFVLIVDDPDAPQGTFTHWIQFDIPASMRALPGRQPAAGLSGKNDFQHDGYKGPCPPPNHGVHRYYFTLYAVDLDSLGLKGGARREEVEHAMQGHVLGHAELMGLYERKAGRL
jgi:Raf kinase inhibitor-like YbhB/YbcL family protein